MLFSTFIFFKTLITTCVAIKYAIITHTLSKKNMSDSDNILSICSSALYTNKKTAGNLYTISILDNARMLTKNIDNIDLNNAFNYTIQDANNCATICTIYATSAVSILENIRNMKNNVKIFANLTEVFASMSINYASFIIDPYNITALNMAFIARSAAIIAYNDMIQSEKYCNQANKATENAIDTAYSASKYVDTIYRIANCCPTNDDFNCVYDISEKINKLI